MNGIKRVIFIVWIVAITILSIIPHANENGGISFKLTESGMGLHFVAYFIAAALFYWKFRKGPQITQISRIQGNRNEELGISKKEIGPQITPVPSPGATGRAQITRITRKEMKDNNGGGPVK